MGCASSNPKVGVVGGGKKHANNANQNNSSRFCSCDTDDGTSSFICEICKKIKKKNTKIAKRAIKKSFKEKQKKDRLKQLKNLQPVGYDDNDKQEKRVNEEQHATQALSPGKRKNMLAEVIDLRMFQEMALRKIFRDYDVDKNGTMNAHEIRDMILNYQAGNGIYRPPTIIEADAFIKNVLGPDEDDANVLGEREFIRGMMNTVEKRRHRNTQMSDTDLLRAMKKIEQFASTIVDRLELRALTLYSLFQKYSNTHFVKKRGAWVNNVLDISDLFRMMTDYSTNPKHRPTQEDVFQFMQNMDTNGDMNLQAREFLSYMLRGMVQSEDALKAFSKRSKMHLKISYFLKSLDDLMVENEKTVSLNKDTVRQLLVEINEVLSHGNKFHVEEVKDNSMGIGSSVAENTLISSLTMNDIANIADTVEEQNELLDLHQSKKDFQARVERTEKEKKLIHNKQAEHTQKKLREREQRRVMSLYNPTLLRKAALEMDNEEMKLRILNIVGETSPKANEDIGGFNRSGDDRKKKLFERQKSRRISVSTRNLKRMHTDFLDDQDRLNEEKEILKQKQKAKTREKLRKKRSFARKQGKLKRKSTKRKSMKSKSTIPHPPADYEDSNYGGNGLNQSELEKEMVINAQKQALKEKKKEIKLLKKQMKKQKVRQQKLDKLGYDDVSLNHSGDLNRSNDSLNGSVGKTKLPRLVKLNPGMNTMSLSFKPTMSLSLSGQSDNMIQLENSAGSDYDDYEESDSTTSNTSSKKSSSTSTIAT